MGKCRLIMGTFATIAAVSLGGIYVSAANPEDSILISVETDKTEYSVSDEISETITIKNNTGKEITDITLEGNVPDAYKLKEGTSGTWSMAIDKIEAGKAKELPTEEILAAAKGDETTKPEDKKDETTKPEDKKDETTKPEDKKDETTKPEDKKDDGKSEIKSDKTSDGQNSADINKSDDKNVDNNSSKQIDGGNKTTDNKQSAVKPVNKVKTSPKKKGTVNTSDCFVALFWIAVAAFGVTAVVSAIKNKKTKQLFSLALAVVLAGGALPASGITVKAEEAAKTKTVIKEDAKLLKIDGVEARLWAKISYNEEVSDEAPSETTEEKLLKEGYKLKWEDNFSGDELNRDDWNVEEHEPGWVNAEWQRYVDSDENIQVKDGNLYLKPIKTENEDGTYSYTSGRVNTQGKHDFKYGYFECRAKVPTGKGYLPAFWMMPTDENLYGQWPKCGEIDIMEVMGQETNKAYGTIHYGEPHDQSQGTCTVDASENFADNYHTYACEWEPGKIVWYIDGVKYHEESDWFSAKEGQGEVSYPAPFDQPFYMILNLAVGGSWVGYPDESTTYDDQQFAIDYVKVYQKDSYNEDVEKPVKDVILREPDKNGNYINNGDFSVAEDLSDDKDWKFLTALDGEGSARIEDNQIIINTTNSGTADYSIQLVQPDLPMQKGGWYEVSFDAYASEARTMITDISAPDHNYVRYLPDTTVELGTEKQTYTYKFHMTNNDDANGRLEFNLGKTSSTATVYISNVQVKKTSYEEIVEDTTKKVLADGNCVYNGEFQEGKNRLSYWELAKDDDTKISVTNDSNVRQLKVVASDNVSEEHPVVIGQSGLALTDGTTYAMSFMANGDAGKTIKVSVAGRNFEEELTGEEKTYNETFKIDSEADKDFKFVITNPGTYYIDSVRIVEDSLIKNGSFNAGTAGYEGYIDSSASASWVVDSLSEENAADFTIKNTGDAEWKIQLKQSGVKLEKDKCYKLSMKMKSSINRDVSFALQRNGAIHKTDDGAEDWTPYCQKVVSLSEDYQTYSATFKMTEDTDNGTIFNIAMGAVKGVQISEQHRICIDDIELEEIDESELEIPVATPKPSGEELLVNADFSSGTDGWQNIISTDNDAAAAVSVNSVAKAVTYNITNVGTADWHVQMKQDGLQLEKGAQYKVKFDITSTESRTVKFALLGPDKRYKWYGGADLTLEAGNTNSVDMTIDMSEETDTNASFVISMGKIADEDTPASDITISNISLVKIGE